MTLSHYVCQHLQRICQSCALNFVILLINIFSFLWFFYRSPAICIHLPFNFKANWLAIKMLGKAKNFLFLLFIWIYLFFFFFWILRMFFDDKNYMRFMYATGGGAGRCVVTFTARCVGLSLRFSCCLLFAWFLARMRFNTLTHLAHCVCVCVCVCGRQSIYPFRLTKSHKQLHK